MELLFAHLADYVTEDRSNKLVIGGTFDSIFTSETRPIVLPAFWLVAEIDAHITEGTEHKAEIRFTDADGRDIIPKVELPIKFTPRGPGRPLRARLTGQIGAGMNLPDNGEYSFHILVDGRRIGGHPLHVVARPAAPSA